MQTNNLANDKSEPQGSFFLLFKYDFMLPLLLFQKIVSMISKEPNLENLLSLLIKIREFDTVQLINGVMTGDKKIREAHLAHMERVETAISTAQALIDKNGPTSGPKL